MPCGSRKGHLWLLAIISDDSRCMGTHWGHARFFYTGCPATEGQSWICGLLVRARNRGHWEKGLPERSAFRLLWINVWLYVLECFSLAEVLCFDWQILTDFNLAENGIGFILEVTCCWDLNLKVEIAISFTSERFDLRTGILANKSFSTGMFF